MYLISQEPGENAVGDPIMLDGEPRRVYANRLSVRQSEHYQAMQIGFKAELMFEVRAIDYQGESKLKHADKEYRIIRTYKKGEMMELICGGFTGE